MHARGRGVRIRARKAATRSTHKLFGILVPVLPYILRAGCSMGALVTCVARPCARLDHGRDAARSPRTEPWQELTLYAYHHLTDRTPVLRITPPRGLLNAPAPGSQVPAFPSRAGIQARRRHSPVPDPIPSGIARRRTKIPRLNAVGPGQIHSKRVPSHTKLVLLQSSTTAPHCFVPGYTLSLVHAPAAIGRHVSRGV